MSHLLHCPKRHYLLLKQIYILLFHSQCFVTLCLNRVLKIRLENMLSLSTYHRMQVEKKVHGKGYEERGFIARYELSLILSGPLWSRRQLSVCIDQKSILPRNAQLSLSAPENSQFCRTIPCTMVSSNNEAQVFALSAGFSRASSFEDFTGRHDISSNIIADSIAKYLGKFL